MTSYLDVARKFNENLQIPFDFMETQRQRFVNRNNDLRDMFIANQQVPEKLSATKFNNVQNQFKLQNLNQNKEDLLEQSRLDAQFGLNNSRFRFENQPNTQDLSIKQNELDLLTTNNKILNAEGEDIFQKSLAETLNDPTRDSLQSADDLLARTSKNAMASSLAKKEIRQRFSTPIRKFNDNIKTIQVGKNAVDDINAGVYGNAGERKVPNSVKRQVTSMIRALEENHERIEFLHSRNLLTAEESSNYETFLELKGSDSVQENNSVSEPTETPLQSNNTLPQETPVANNQPVDAQQQAINQRGQVQPVEPQVRETPVQEVQQGQNAIQIRNVDPELFTVLNTPPTPETASEQLRVIRERLSEPDGLQIFKNLGYSDEDMLNMVTGLKSIESQQSPIEPDSIGAVISNPQKLDGFKIRFPRMAKVLDTVPTSENVNELRQIANDFLEVENNRGVLLQLIGPQEFTNLMGRLDDIATQPEIEADKIQVEEYQSALRSNFENDPDIEAFIESEVIPESNTILGDKEAVSRAITKMLSDKNLPSYINQELLEKIERIREID